MWFTFLTLDQFHHPQTLVTATCGPMAVGESRQSGPLAMFQEIQGEDTSGEERSEADMSEERNAEGGEIKIYVRDKNNCTTLETSLREFRFRMFLRPMYCLPADK